LKIYILDNDITSGEALDGIDDDVKQEVLAAVEFAENSPAPELSEIYDNVYEETDYPFIS
jgi:pyruvate dehydrogenase E1 component alpha subunit